MIALLLLVIVGTWNVPAGDLDTVHDLGLNTVVKSVPTIEAALTYLDRAQAEGIRVIVQMPPVLVDPALATTEATALRGHPALAGYLSVVEPHDKWPQADIAARVRDLYRRYHAGDPRHPVYVSYGYMTRFGTSFAPWVSGGQDVSIVEWYRWSASCGTRHTLAQLRHASAVVRGPAVLMVGIHHCRSLTAGTLKAELTNARAIRSWAGTLLYTWNGPAYPTDLRRNPGLTWAVAMPVAARAGTTVSR